MDLVWTHSLAWFWPVLSWPLLSRDGLSSQSPVSVTADLLWSQPGPDLQAHCEMMSSRNELFSRLL